MVIPPHPTSLLLHKCAPTLQLSVVNAPLPPLLAVSLQGRRGPPPPPSGVRAYSPLLSAMLPQQFDPPLRPSDVPDPLPQIQSLYPLSINLPPPPSILLQGLGGTLLLPSVTQYHTHLLPVLRLQQVVPPLMHANVPAPLDQLSDLPLQLGGPGLQTSSVNPPPPISALLLQQELLNLRTSAFSRACWSSSFSALRLDSRARRTRSLHLQPCALMILYFHPCTLSKSSLLFGLHP